MYMNRIYDVSLDCVCIMCHVFLWAEYPFKTVIDLIKYSIFYTQQRDIQPIQMNWETAVSSWRSLEPVTRSLNNPRFQGSHASVPIDMASLCTFKWATDLPQQPTGTTSLLI